MAFWCKGKKGYCDDTSDNGCDGCKHWDDSGGIELEDDEIDDIIIRQWISVKDGLPEPDQKVLAYTSESRGTFEEYRLCCGWAIKGAVTHWIPLPEPPKED